MSVARTWGTTSEERARAYACDRFVPGANDAYWRGVSVDAGAPLVFRWLCQLRAAPYSYDWLDNGGRRSPQTLTPGLEELALGQTVMRIFELVEFERDRQLTLKLRSTKLFPLFAVTYEAVPVEPRRTRLLVKLAIHATGSLRDRIAHVVLPWGDLVMMRRQLLNLKRLAERG